MTAGSETLDARATAVATPDGNALDVIVAGTWQITAPRPSWTEALDGRKPQRVEIRAEGLERWDTSLLLFLFEAEQWCRASGAQWVADALPEKLRKLLGELAQAHEKPAPVDRSEGFLAAVGNAAQETLFKSGEIFSFVGECVL